MFFNIIGIIYFAFCALNNNSKLISNKPLDVEDIIKTGLDERVSKMNNIIENELLEKIQENFHKKQLLDILENNQISIIQKMDILNQYLFYNTTSLHSNLFAGGLLDDWDFEFK
tara:strand:- start:857 stop:1198 length:342 start_codon:yes stop_codon:yes gene_type:complete